MKPIRNKIFEEYPRVDKRIENPQDLQNAIGFGSLAVVVNDCSYLPVLFNDDTWDYVDIETISVYVESLETSADYITYEEAAKKLRVSIYTLNRWYRWYRNRKEKNLNHKIPPLPPVVTIKKIRHFKQEDYLKLKKFKEFYSSNWGMMRKEYLKNDKKARTQQQGFNKDY